MLKFFKVLFFSVLFLFLLVGVVGLVDHEKTGLVSGLVDVLDVPDLEAGSVTTNYVGKYTCSIRFVFSNTSNSGRTNYVLSRGFVKGKATPLMKSLTIITQADTATVSPVIMLVGLNGTNIQVRVKGVGGLNAGPITFDVNLERPHSYIK